MYCSSCGTVIARGLSYCKHCGVKLNEAKDTGIVQPPQIPAESLVWAIVAVFVVGFGCTIGLMAVMKEVVHFNDGLIGAFTLASFLLMVLIEVVFIGLLLRRNRMPQEVYDTASLKERETLDATPARVLSEPAPSVTEHTTRNFEPIHNEPKSK